MAQARRELSRMLREVRDEKVDLVHGSIEIAQLRHWFAGSERDPDFNLFVLIKSETDHILVGEARTFYSAEALERAEQETRSVQAFYRERAIAACDNLLRRFAEAPPPG